MRVIRFGPSALAVLVLATLLSPVVTTTAQAAGSTTTARRSAAAPVAGSFVAVTPRRILDTGTGLGAPPAAVGPRQILTFQVGGREGVPATGVSAVTLNVTVANSSAAGYVTAFAAGSMRPKTSNVNFGRGQATPNLVVVSLGAGGQVALYNGSAGTVRLIADVSGYYVSGAATAPGAYVPLPPARVLDTGSTPVSAHQTLTVQVAGRGGLPTSGVQAAQLNLTVASATGHGYVTAYPFGVTRPLASTVNFYVGPNRANAVVVRLGSAGRISIYNRHGGTVRLVLDVVGYYRDGAATASGTLVPLTPTRVLDTLTGVGAPMAPVAAGATLVVPFAGRGGIPTTGVTAVLLNVTVASASSTGYVATYAGPNLEGTSDLNHLAHLDVAKLVVSRLRADGTISFYNASTGTVRLIADVSGYYLP